MYRRVVVERFDDEIFVSLGVHDAELLMKILDGYFSNVLANTSGADNLAFYLFDALRSIHGEPTTTEEDVKTPDCE